MIMCDPFSKFIALMMGDLSPPPVQGTRRYVDGVLENADGQILEILRERKRITANELMLITGYSKTTVYRSLETLSSKGLIETVKNRDTAGNVNLRLVTFFVIRETDK